MIRAERAQFRIGEFCLQGVSLDVPRGEYFVLLGPPGSGKTVFLECICGLKRLDSGRIYLDDHDVTDLEPRQRSVGYVPQDYALFPHLRVADNIRFGLRARRADRSEADRRTAEAADTLGITHLLTRRTTGLSGGERQRVALARALVVRPKVLLLDEPVATLDESMRETVCGELRRLQQQLGVTTIHVSHHLEEAFSVADRAGILHEGTFQQTGPLGELLRRPRSEFVARFMRCENLLAGKVIGPGHAADTTEVDVRGVRFVVPGRHRGSIKFVIRPENVRLTSTSSPPRGSNTILTGTLIQTVDRGAYIRAALNGRVRLVAHLSHDDFAELSPVTGGELAAVVRFDAIHVLPT